MSIRREIDTLSILLNLKSGCIFLTSNKAFVIHTQIYYLERINFKSTTSTNENTYTEFLFTKIPPS